MTSIKPPGTPPGPPVAPVNAGTDVVVTTPPTGGVTGSASVPARADVRATAVQPGTQSVLNDLKAARITPDEAVQRLTTLSIERGGVPPSLRPAVEQRIRAMLANDPRVGALLRRMGATVPADEE